MVLKNLTSFQKVLSISIGTIILLGIIDIMGIPIWDTDQVQLYGQIFWTFAYTIAVVISLVYFILTKDKSEALAIFAAFIILLKFGLQDLTFYLIQGEIPQSMPHLFEHAVMGRVAELLGLSTVTPTSLVVSVIIGIGITFYVVRWLRRLN